MVDLFFIFFWIIIQTLIYLQRFNRAIYLAIESLLYIFNIRGAGYPEFFRRLRLDPET